MTAPKPDAAEDSLPAAAAYLGRARCHQKRDDPDAALKDLDAAVELDPRSAAALTQRAEVHAANGDASRAEEDRRNAAMWARTAT